MGETDDEVVDTLADLRAVDVDIVTIGQYLRPTTHHLPVAAMGSAGVVRAVPPRGRGARDRACRGLAVDPFQLPRPDCCRRRGATVRGSGSYRVRMTAPTSAYADRLAKVRDAMTAKGIDVLLLSVGADLPWLTGYEAMPLERLTMLVAHRDGEATLVVPRLEAPRVVEQPGVFTIRPWAETDDPVAIVAGLVGAASTAAIGDTTWARFLLALQKEMPATAFTRSVEVTGALRAQKDAAEIEALRRAGAAADRVATALQAGDIALVGRTEAEVSAEISARLLAEGHHQVNFAIVAAGENAASPHHDASSRRHSQQRGRALRLRRSARRLLQRHHSLRVHRPAVCPDP